MIKAILKFLKNTYMVLLIFVMAIVFFLVYNTYLVDSSLASLQSTLDKVDNVKTITEAQMLASMLNYSLITEVSSRELKVSSMSKIELAKDILIQTKDKSRLEDAKVILREVVQDKEKKRPVVLAFLDKINKLFAPLAVKLTKIKLENRVRYLKWQLDRMKSRPGLEGIYYELAGVYSELSEFNKARAAYEKVIELNPHSQLGKMAQFNLAWNQKRRGNLDESMKAFEALSKTSANEEMAIFSQYQIADVLRKKGEYEKAADIYQDLARKQPKTDLAKVADFQAGSTYLYDLKDYEKAKEVFDRLKIQAKGSNLGDYLDKKGASKVLDQYRNFGFQPLIEGYKTSSDNKYREALENFDRILTMEPKDGISFIGKALAYFWLKEPDKALILARQAVKLAPQNEIISTNLTYIYIQLNMLEEAIDESRRFIAVAPKSAAVYYNLGYAYIKKNRLEDAAVVFRQAIAVNPAFIIAYNNLGWCYWKLGQPALAIETFEKAHKIKPNFFDTLFNLAVSYNTVGRVGEAQKLFEKALELKPG